MDISQAKKAVFYGVLKHVISPISDAIIITEK
jgi:hypothetical protein